MCVYADINVCVCVCVYADINECEGGEGWEGDPVMCEGATYCENTPGSHQCRACHVACLGGCRGAGPTNCNDCKDGFKMDDGECKGQKLSHTPTLPFNHTHYISLQM